MRSSFKESYGAPLTDKKITREKPLSFVKKPSTIAKKPESTYGRRSTPVRREVQGQTTAGNDFLRAELRDSAKRMPKDTNLSGRATHKAYRDALQTKNMSETKIRPSSTSSYKSTRKQEKDTETGLESSKPLQWSKDDPRFRTCDSMSEAKKSEKSIKRTNSSNKVEKISFSQKSIIQSIEALTKKSAHYYFENQNKPSPAEDKDCPYTRLSSSYKFSSSNHNLGESQKFSRSSMSRLFKHPSIDKKVSPDSHKKGTGWIKERNSVQTTGELKDMITQGMHKIDHLLVESPRMHQTRLNFQERKSHSKRKDGSLSNLENLLHHSSITSTKHHQMKKDIDQLYYVSKLKHHLKTKDPDVFTSIFKDHFQLSFNSVRFSRVLDHVEIEKFLELNQLKLPQSSMHRNKHTIVFDLDETLVHCEDAKKKGDEIITIVIPNGRKIETAIFIRPYAREILKELSKHFELVVFTASHKGYADKVIDLLDPENKYISHRLFREHCFKTKQGVYVKDLRILNRRLERVVLVDNAMYSFVLQLNNGVPIIPFNDNKADLELQHLTSFLLNLRHAEDVRVVIKQHFKYEALVQAKDIQECASLMFPESH